MTICWDIVFILITDEQQTITKGMGQSETFTIADIASVHHVFTLRDGRNLSIAGDIDQIVSLLFIQNPTNTANQTPILTVTDHMEAFNFTEVNQSPDDSDIIEQ